MIHLQFWHEGTHEIVPSPFGIHKANYLINFSGWTRAISIAFPQVNFCGTVGELHWRLFASYFVTNALKLQYNSTICFLTKCISSKHLVLMAFILGGNVITKYFVVTIKFRPKTVHSLKKNHSNDGPFLRSWNRHYFRPLQRNSLSRRKYAYFRPLQRNSLSRRKYAEKFVSSVFSSATGEILHNCYQITTIFPRISVAHCLTNKSFVKFILI